MRFELTRRNFLATGALGLAGAAMAGMGLQSCGKAGSTAPEANGDPVEGTTADTINSSGIVVDPSKTSETIDCGVLVVGCGLSGLAASVQAAMNGDRVIALEGQSVVGGNGQGVEGTFAVNSRFQKEQGIEVDKSVVMQEELGKPQWYVNGLFYKDLINDSAANLEWLADECGVEFSGLIDNYPFGAGGGKVDSFHWYKDGAAAVGYLVPMEAKARELGVDIRLNNRALEFYYDENGEVNGVYAQDAFGDLVIFRAPTVIVATGGFANDDKRLVKHGFNLDMLELIGTPGHWGDGINMILAAGGMEYTGVCYLKYNRIGRLVDIATFGPFYGAFCSGGKGMWVNGDMERFVDESCARRTGNNITQSAPIHLQDGCAYLVCDAAIIASLSEEFANQAAEWGVDLDAQWQALYEKGEDAWQANSIAELAEKAGFDAKALQAAVDEYNSDCENGKDEWFGKDAEYLVPIATPPFTMARIHEAMEGPLGGVTIDRSFRPVKLGGGRMENVFCIGLDSMMLYRDVYPIDVPGTASAECINGGRTAAKHAHEIVQERGEHEAETVEADGRMKAKWVIMSAIDLFATMDLGLTDKDSPATIGMDDPKFAEFFKALKGKDRLAGIELSSCSFEARIAAVHVATAREDSQQQNYRYTLTSADMTVDGSHASYNPKDGLSVD
ncbi:FAD-binding protein [Slackia exigua]|uniref:FAD-binding protein n=1 Tax=Slackia exigua TaxID=84109 RepID=UPI00210D2685|nr:FAD-binding protein [Slackia exigua]MCQ5090634.1 FAD-binding protein [Slackia exigua]